MGRFYGSEIFLKIGEHCPILFLTQRLSLMSRIVNSRCKLVVGTACAVGIQRRESPPPPISGSWGCLEKAVSHLGAGCREGHGVRLGTRPRNPDSHCRGPSRQPLGILAIETLRLTPFKLERPVTRRALWLSKRATETHVRRA